METIKRSMTSRSLWGDEYTEYRKVYMSSEDTLNDIIIVDTCHYTFVQTH